MGHLVYRESNGYNRSTYWPFLILSNRESQSLLTQNINQMFNPAPRTAVITALMHPERYLGTNASPVPSNAISPAKGKHRASNKAESAQAQNMMPDTALLFKGYLESGRMVNVYDWYMAFKQGLEAQRRTLRKTDPGLVDRKRKGKDQRKRLGGKAQPETPTKPRGTGRRGRRGRGRVSRGSRFNGRPDVDPESDGHDDETGDESDDDEMNPEERERWEAEVQARFLRSVQELDLVGFIKHTGRKADHVQKTVFELAEYA